MRRSLYVILWLAMIPAAFGSIVSDPSRLAIPSNFDHCQNLHSLSPTPAPEFDPSLVAFASTSGSITGFIDFTTTDSILHFLDVYVAGGLQSTDLRHTLQHYLRLDFTGIEAQFTAIYQQIANN